MVTINVTIDYHYSLGHSRPTVLDRLLGVGSGEDHDGVELRVVQLVHGVGGHVQQSVLPLVHDISDGRQSHNTRLASFSCRVKF